MIHKASDPSSIALCDTQIKAHGIHYTPAELARYLAESLVAAYQSSAGVPQKTLNILDPACGDGELLLALLTALPHTARNHIRVIGCDTDAVAIERAKRRLDTCGVMRVDIVCEDFLALISRELDGQLPLGGAMPRRTEMRMCGTIDLIISNPPYVRTQVLGASQARVLASQFGLQGRIDLYHAFVIAMTSALKPNGYLGLLTSNRFLSTQAGASLRSWLLNEMTLHTLIDLGDTRLFEAAVLPAILIGKRGRLARADQQCVFRRVYETESDSSPNPRHETVLMALSAENCGTVDVASKQYRIETGILRTSADDSAPWMLSSDKTDQWMETIRKNMAGTFSGSGDVKVGIKTTADKVFIRDDWESMPPEQRPESELLHSLITHHAAERWSLTSNACGTRRVLYPYTLSEGKRCPINFADFPKAGRYLESYRAVLEKRKYVIEAGRMWYEIWVPHSPSAWSTEKLAFPDISERNVFFMCPSEAVVNGDCYWISPKLFAPPHALKAMLAVANSSFALRYYDVMFHNKLYAGRRRFMSQYVAQFPLPREKHAVDLAGLVTQLLKAKANNNKRAVDALDDEIDCLVWESFGLCKEA